MKRSDVQTFQMNLVLLVEGYKSVRLSVNTAKTQILIYKTPCMYGLHSTVVVTLDFHAIDSSYSLKYGTNIKYSRTIVDSVITRLRISYAKVVSLKFSLNRKVSSRPYSAVA